MRLTRKALSVFLALVMALGCFSVAIVNVSAISLLQAMINSTPNYGTLTLTDNMVGQSAIIENKSITIDFDGYSVKGADAKPVFEITGNSYVTIKNGFLESRFGPFETAKLTKQMLVSNSEPAIEVNGSSAHLTLYNCFVQGAKMRIPTTTNRFLPIGSAVELVNGAGMYSSQNLLLGRYGINNAVTGAVPGGSIVINDGIYAGFMDAVKDMDDVYVAGTSYDPVDFLEDLFPDGVSFNSTEKDLLTRVLDNRMLVAFNDPMFYPDYTCTDGQLDLIMETLNSSTYSPGKFLSYKWIPELITMDGTTAGTADYTDADYGDTHYLASGVVSKRATADVQLRLYVDLYQDKAGNEYVDLVNNLPQTILDLYTQLPSILDDVIDTGTGYLVDMKADLFDVAKEFLNLPSLISAVPAPPSVNPYAEGYQVIKNALIALGGDDILNYSYDMTIITGYGDGLFNPLFAELDDFNALPDLEAKINYLITNGKYDDLVDLAKGIINEADKILGVILSDPWSRIFEVEFGEGAEGLQAIFQPVIDMKPFIDQMNSLVGMAKQVLEMYDQYAAHPLVTDTLNAFAENNNVGDLLKKIENIGIYIQPEFVDGTCLGSVRKTEQVSFDLINVNTTGYDIPVDVMVEGSGTVRFNDFMQSQFSSASHLFKYTSLSENASVRYKLSAVPDEGNIFLYWLDRATNKIVSFTRDYYFVCVGPVRYQAVFAPSDEPTLTYIGNSNCVIERQLLASPSGAPTAPTLEFWAFSAYAPFEYPSGSDGYGTSNAILKAAYVPDPTATCSVTFDNPDSLNLVGDGEFARGKVVAVLAPADNFSYWIDAESGEIVSYNNLYTFYHVRDIVLKPIYNGATTGASIRISGSYYNAEKDQLTFYAERAIKGSYSVIEHGILLYPGETNEDDMVIGGLSVIKGTSKDTAFNGVYSLTKGNAYAGELWGDWTARAYLIVSTSGGEIQTIYSDLFMVY